MKKKKTIEERLTTVFKEIKEKTTHRRVHKSDCVGRLGHIVTDMVFLEMAIKDEPFQARRRIISWAEKNSARVMFDPVSLYIVGEKTLVLRDLGGFYAYPEMRW